MIVVKAFIDIGKFWAKDAEGEPRTPNSIAEELKGTELQLTRYTLTAARDGRLEKVDLINQVKLARLCSKWVGRQVSIDEIVRIED